MRGLLFVPLLYCLLLSAACSKQPVASADAGADASPATPVEVAKATTETMHGVVAGEGVLYPIRQANIVGKISAPVARFLVQRGDHVREGQLLAVLEDRDLVAAAQESKQQYEQAVAAYQNTTAATMPDDLTRAQTDYRSAEQALDAAQRVYDSRVNLLHQGAIAQKLVDDAKVALVQAQSQAQTFKQHLTSLQTVGEPAQLRSAKAQVDAAKAHYESAAAQVAYAEVRTPIGGIVSDRPLNVGELASAGSPLVSVVDISSVVARVNVGVKTASAIHLGKPASITSAGATLQGKVSVVSPVVDPNATTIQIWVQAANRQEVLKPGTTVQVSIETTDISKATAVAATALLNSEEGGEKVLVVGSDNTVESRKVEVGIRTPELVQILSGVKPGEQVVTSGGLGLDDKAKVQISKSDAAETANKADAGDKQK